MNARDLVFLFARTWKEKYATNYPVTFGRDGAIFKSLLATYSSDELHRYIVHYLTRFNDPFHSNAGHNVGLFKVALPKVIAEIAKEARAKSSVKESSEDYKKLEEARKRLGE